MLNILPNIGRPPTDGADVQSRLAGRGDGASPDARNEGAGRGFDDVFAKMNRGTPSTRAADADDGTARPTSASIARPAQDGGAAPDGLADLLVAANESSVTDDARVAARPVMDVTELQPADVVMSAASSLASIDLANAGSQTGQGVASAPAVSALATLAELVNVASAPTSGRTSEAPSGPLSPTNGRRKTTDTTEADTQAVDATEAVLAAMMLMPAPATNTGTGSAAAPPPPSPRASKAADMPASPLSADSTPELPHNVVAAVTTTDEASRDSLPKSRDAQIEIHPGDGERTPVSVVAQTTHFPVVERLSVSHQLAAPISQAASAIPDTPIAAAQTAPLRTLDITLSPGDLGSVTISMRLIGGNIHLGVEAQDADTARLIERDKATLATALHASGYSVAELNIVHGAEAGAQTQSGSDNASQHQQRSPVNGDASGSDTSGDGAGTGDHAFARARNGAQPDQPGGPNGEPAARLDRGVYL